MIIKNCFYKNPKLQKSVRRKETDYLKASDHGEMIGWDDNDDDHIGQYKWKYQIQTIWLNTGYCIRQVVDHCIVSYALDHIDQKKFDTKDCVMDRDDMRKLILKAIFQI